MRSTAVSLAITSLLSHSLAAPIAPGAALEPPPDAAPQTAREARAQAREDRALLGHAGFVGDDDDPVCPAPTMIEVIANPPHGYLNWDACNTKDASTANMTYGEFRKIINWATGERMIDTLSICYRSSCARRARAPTPAANAPSPTPEV